MGALMERAGDKLLARFSRGRLYHPVGFLRQCRNSHAAPSGGAGVETVLHPSIGLVSRRSLPQGGFRPVPGGEAPEQLPRTGVLRKTSEGVLEADKESASGLALGECGASVSAPKAARSHIGNESAAWRNLKLRPNRAGTTGQANLRRRNRPQLLLSKAAPRPPVLTRPIPRRTGQNTRASEPRKSIDLRLPERPHPPERPRLPALLMGVPVGFGEGLNVQAGR